MQKVILTSDNFNDSGSGLNEKNNFLQILKKYFEKEKIKALFISSNPKEHVLSSEYLKVQEKFHRDAGLNVENFILLDDRNSKETQELIEQSNYIILAGGHVPTQNKFFMDIDLKNKIQKFQGLIVGISAGSMNSADFVYAMPEEDGEIIDENYIRFLRGLNLTKKMIIPHFQYLLSQNLDGKNMIQDIALNDSFGKKFYCLVDGSFIEIENGKEKIYGEAYLIKDGEITEINSDERILEI